jgi:DegV family protein with EDD domain
LKVKKPMHILTDSAADLPAGEAQALGITVAPLYIQFPEGEVSSEQIPPDDFYTRLQGMVPEVPTTSQPSAGDFKELYQGISNNGETILSIHISSGLSGTIEAARLGAKKLNGTAVTHVDTLTLSGGERFQVLAAARAAKAGWTIESILERLRRIQQASEVVYTLETLEYLARGGRIGRVQALAGSLLRLKPIIHVDQQDGRYNTAGKARTIARALMKIVTHLESRYSSSTPLWVTVLHGQFEEPAARLAQALEERLAVAKMEILRISPVLGVHTGPGIVGAAVVPMELMTDFA